MKKIVFLFIISFFISACSHSNNVSNGPINNNIFEGADVLDVDKIKDTAEVKEEIKDEKIFWKDIQAQDVEGVYEAFRFKAAIPSDWQLEAIPAIEALNIYDPKISGDSNLEKSQIFIRHFKANTFLTLSTVNIYSQEETSKADRPAVVYDIVKKSGVADFVSQPSWRNKRHIVTDIRVSDSSPSTFYVIAQNPDLDNEIYQQFLNSLQVDIDTSEQNLVLPIDNFYDRISKKPFGIYITPQNSPVQPEKFTGYHTGVDVEYGDVEKDVEVRAIADGLILRSEWVSGYGGMVAIRHQIDGQNYIVIYGHLDPDSLLAKNTQVSAGEVLGILGETYSQETDQERKHLHLSIYTGSDINVRGYVSSQSDLSKWVDPIDFLK